MLERRVRGNSHARCGVGENSEITSKNYLSLYIIPSDLNTYGGEAKRLLEDLQSRNERMFLVTALFLNTAKTKQALDNAIFQTAGIAQKYNCVLKRLDYQQEEGLMSSVPLGVNHIPIKRALYDYQHSNLCSIYDTGTIYAGESLYYGLNALSNNMIMVDRKKLKNPNGLILGTPGSGKSFAAKREITNAFFVTKDDIIIGDPEGEYYHWSMHLADRSYTFHRPVRIISIRWISIWIIPMMTIHLV